MTGDHLGQTVAISGDTIVAGAPDKNLGHPEEGAVYVFVRPPGGWTSVTTTARLSASDRAEDDHLGFSVAISGNTIAAGAPGSADPSGAAYVFVKPPTGWTDNEDTAKLTVSASALRFLGQSVAVSGDTVVVGAPIDGNRGAAYVYVKPGGGWVDGIETAKLTAQTGRLNDELGYAVAMDGNTIAVAARAARHRGVEPHRRSGCGERLRQASRRVGQRHGERAADGHRRRGQRSAGRIGGGLRRHRSSPA